MPHFLAFASVLRCTWPRDIRAMALSDLQARGRRPFALGYAWVCIKDKKLRDLAHVCLLVLVPGVLAWFVGRPLIFPSLGPSALALVLDDKGNRSRQVLGGHFCGVLSGLIAYHALARGLSPQTLAPALSADGLSIAISGVVSVGLTTLAMLATRTIHAPAFMAPVAIGCCPADGAPPT